MKAHRKVINRALKKVIATNFIIFLLVFSLFFINTQAVDGNVFKIIYLYFFNLDDLTVQKEELIHIRNHIAFNQLYQSITSLT